MVQFVLIIFFLDFFNFCWVFQKFPFFVSLCIMGSLSYMPSVFDQNVVMWSVPVLSDSFVAFQMPALYDVRVKSAVM